MNIIKHNKIFIFLIKNICDIIFILNIENIYILYYFLFIS